MDFCYILKKILCKLSLQYLTEKEVGSELTWFIMVESLAPSWIFFSSMFSNFTSLSDGIYKNRYHYLDLYLRQHHKCTTVQLKSLYQYDTQYPAGDAHGFNLGRFAAKLI